MKIRIEYTIKEEFLDADINYQYALKGLKAEYPHGINFCYETVSAKAATAYCRLQEATARYNALAAQVVPKLKGARLEKEAVRLIDRINNAETTNEWEAARTEYFALYDIAE